MHVSVMGLSKTPQWKQSVAYQNSKLLPNRKTYTFKDLSSFVNSLSFAIKIFSAHLCAASEVKYDSLLLRHCFLYKTHK